MSNESSSRTTSPHGYRAGLVDNVFIVVWEQVRSGAMPHLISEARQAAAACSEPPVYLAVVPDGAPAPDDAARRALNEATKTMVDLFGSMHCVIEGAGFKKSVIRGVAASIFLLSGGKRGKMQVHDTVSEALHAAGIRNSTSIVQQAQRLGLVSS